MADETVWGKELVPEGWFAPETQADGWFDGDLLDVATAGGLSRQAQIGSASSLTVTATIRRSRQAVSASTSSLTVLAKVRRNRQAVIAAVSTLSAVGTTAGATSAAAAMASASSLTVRATVISRRAAVVASASTLAVVAKVRRNRQAAASAVSGLSVIARVTLRRAVLIAAQGTLDATASTGVVAPVRRVGGADVQRKTRIKEWFLERQLREFEESLAEIGEAEPEDAPEAVEAALEAFEPIVARVDDRQSLAAVRAISEALRTVADTRQARNAAVVEVEAQLALIAAIQRRKRRDEAAILLLM